MNLRDLLDEPGVEEQCVLRSTVGFMALHGGSQDRGTDLIALQAAAQAGASYYGIVQPPNLRVHIPSRRHDPACSPTLQRFLHHIEVAISVHGFGRDSLRLGVDPSQGLVVEPYGPPVRPGQRGPLRGIILGGRNAELLAKSRALLTGRIDGYHVADGRVRLGFHPANPVNLPPAAGVQVELPPGLRGIGPFGDRLVPDDRDPGLRSVVTALAELAELAGHMVPSPS